MSKREVWVVEGHNKGKWWPVTDGFLSQTSANEVRGNLAYGLKKPHYRVVKYVPAQEQPE